MTAVLIKQPCEDRQTGRMNVMWQQSRHWNYAAACLGMPENHQKLGRGKNSPIGFRGSMALPITWFTLQASRTETINFCCFKPPSLWYFITADIRN